MVDDPGPAPADFPGPGARARRGAKRNPRGERSRGLFGLVRQLWAGPILVVPRLYGFGPAAPSWMPGINGLRRPAATSPPPGPEDFPVAARGASWAILR